MDAREVATLVGALDSNVGHLLLIDLPLVNKLLNRAREDETIHLALSVTLLRMLKTRTSVCFVCPMRKARSWACKSCVTFHEAS